MVTRITAAQARALGVDPKLGSKRRVRRTAKGPYHTRCKVCQEDFHRQVDEDRHLAETGHKNYLLVW